MSARVRPAVPGDDGAVAALASSLSRESLRRRFLGGVARDAASAELCRELHPSSDELAFVAEDPEGALVGEAYAALIEPGRAEAAFVVRDRNQHAGIGTALFDAVVAALRSRGVGSLVLYVLLHNGPMQAIVQRSGLLYSVRLGGDMLEMNVELAPPA